VKGGAGGGDLGQAPFDRRMDVLIRFAEFELAAVELALDAAQAALDRRELRPRQKAGLGQPPRMRDAAGDVERIELEVRFQRRREPLELGMEGLAKTRAPELSSLSPSGRGLGRGA